MRNFKNFNCEFSKRNRQFLDATGNFQMQPAIFRLHRQFRERDPRRANANGQMQMGECNCGPALADEENRIISELSQVSGDTRDALRFISGFPSEIK